MCQKENLLKILDDKINNKHSKKLMECKVDDHATLNAIEKDFQEDLESFGITKEESKEAFGLLKKSHFGMK